MRLNLIVAGLLAGYVVSASAQESLTQADLLRRPIDLDRLAAPPPAGERTGMFTSYDRKSKIDENGKFVEWRANADYGQFLREEADGWQVMAEMNGPGAITRVWSANPSGRIRFILDGQTVIDAPFEDLFNGKLAPFAEPLCYANPDNGGKNCYFPLGYAKSCKIILRDSRAYYQVNYVTFAPGTTVETFKPQLDAAAQTALADVSKALKEGLSEKQLFGDRRPTPVAEEKEIKKGEKLTQTLEGAGTIRALYVALTDRTNPRDLYALHRCVLRIYWDGQRRPAVEAPLTDFFGSGFDLLPYKSLPLGTDMDPPIPLPGKRIDQAKALCCYFPMPFAQGAQIEIESLNDKKIGLLLLTLTDAAPPAADALRFKARFRKEDPCQVFDYPILETSGRGRIVGCLLNVDCPRPEWWGEGDDKVWIDGERFPSYFGTGSEDYLGDAWGLRYHIQPFEGVTRTASYGKNSAYRWHIFDCINFHKSVRFTIENWQWHDDKDTYYGTIAYWYGEPNAPDFFKPLKPADLAPPGLRIPHAVEIEGRVVGQGWGGEIKQKSLTGVELSGEGAARITTTEPVTINIPYAEDRIVKLSLRVPPGQTFETIEVTEGEKNRVVGKVEYKPDAGQIYPVGLLRLSGGNTPVRLKCGKSVLLDCWLCEPVPKSSAGPEAEDLKVASAGGATVKVEDFTLNWSGGAQLALEFKSVGQTATLALPERKAPEKKDGQEPPPPSEFVTLVVTRGPAGGKFQALLDDQPFGEPFDCYAEKEEIGRAPLGVAAFKPGAHKIGFRALEADKKAAGKRLGLDVIEMAVTRSPHALECEQLRVLAFEKTNHEVQLVSGRNVSAGAQLWCRPTEPGAWLELEVPVKKAGKYKLGIVYTHSWDYGIVQTHVNGKKAGPPCDTYGNLQGGPVTDLGAHDLPAGPLKIKCELIGKAENSPGYFLGIDCVILEPVGR